MNWTNWWRATFIMILLAVLCNVFHIDLVAKFLGFVGGAVFIFLFVIRFDDVKKFLNDSFSED